MKRSGIRNMIFDSITRYNSTPTFSRRVCISCDLLSFFLICNFLVTFPVIAVCDESHSKNWSIFATSKSSAVRIPLQVMW
jgi:hypothetical protein